MFNEYLDEEFKNLVKYHYKDEYNFNDSFKERILAIQDMLIYQQVLIYINEKDVKFADEIESEKISQLDNMIKSYEGKNIDFIRDANISNIKNIIAYRFFKDNFNNVLINSKEIINFCSTVEKTILSGEDLEIYKKIINMDYMTTEQLIKLYNEFKNIEANIKSQTDNETNLGTTYYDDYRKCIDYSHELLYDALTDFDKDENTTLADNKYIVHELNGQPFGMLITCGSIKPFFEEKDTQKQEESGFLSLWAHIGERFNDTATSLSFLDENFIKSNWHGTVIGFKKKNINPNQIIAENPFDLDTGSSDFNVPTLKYTNTIITPKDLSRRTSANGHNEIIYRCKSNDRKYKNNELNDNLDALIPAYIICYNEITQEQVNIAREIEEEFGVKLEFILIHEEKYKSSIHYETEEEQKQRNSKYITKEY